MKTKNKLTLNWLKEAKSFSCLNENPSVMIVKHPEGKFLIERFGSCKPDKCKSICCKLFGVNSIDSYYGGFGRKGKSGTIFDIECRHLKKGKCRIWKKDKFPRPCIQFPHPNDPIYHEVMHKCGFYFKITGTFKEGNNETDNAV